MVKTAESRRNIYSYALLGSIGLIALIGLLNVWDAGIDSSTTMKSIGTFAVIAGLSGFLYTLTHNHDVKIIKKLGNFTGVAAAALSGVIILQIWFNAFDEIFFGKITVTIVILGLLAAFVIAVFDDFFENKKMKDENYLD